MIAAVVPTLNEEDAIGWVLERVPSSIDGHAVKVFVVDGGSEDRTCEIAAENGADVINQRYRGGKGAAMRQAFDDIDAGVFVFLDGDGTYDPEEMEGLVSPVLDGEAEHVAGSRIERREEGAIPFFNLIGNKLFNWTVRWVYGADIRDMLSGYRAIDGELAERLPVLQDGFGIETELTVLTLDSDASLREIPIRYLHRKGSSKLHPVRDGFNILKTILWMVRDTRPLRFFSLLSMMFVALAVYPTYVTIRQKLLYGVVSQPTPAIVATLFYIFALQVFLFGLMADQRKNMQKRLQKLISRQ